MTKNKIRSKLFTYSTQIKRESLTYKRPKHLNTILSIVSVDFFSLNREIDSQKKSVRVNISIFLQLHGKIIFERELFHDKQTQIVSHIHIVADTAL